MTKHSAKSLFDSNIASADECINLFDGIVRLQTRLEVSWLLRASVVFSVSALDAYFHDKVRYRAGQFRLENMPRSFAEFQIPLMELSKWDRASRKGNVFRGWLVAHFGTRPLQRKDDIAEALRMVGIEKLWSTIESNSPARDALMKELARYVHRRNQIAHEGDRESSRRSGKRLRTIDRAYAQTCIDFFKSLVERIERAFPR